MTATAIEHQGALWGALAADWAEHEEQLAPTYEAALERVDVTAGRSVLDVGCGSGVFLRLAADRGAAVSGIDASSELVALARARVPEADVRVGDLQSLPWRDDAFDVVTGFNSFFFAADLVGALREARRVTRPGGELVIQVWGRPERCDLATMTHAVRALRPAPSPKVALAEPGVLEALAAEAGLRPREAFDHAYAIDFPDEETLVRLMLSPGPVVEAADHVGAGAVREAISASLAGCRAADGSYRLSNEWHYLVATA